MPTLSKFYPKRGNMARVILSRDSRKRTGKYGVQWKKKDDIVKNISFDSKKEAIIYYERMVSLVKKSFK